MSCKKLLAVGLVLAGWLPVFSGAIASEVPLISAGDPLTADSPEAPESSNSDGLESAFQNYFSRPWSLMIYQGWGTSTDLGQTLVFDVKSENSFFTGLVVNRKMFSFWRFFTFELEGQAIKHYKKQDNGEFNGLFLIRFHPFILDRYLDIDLAVGEGLSYATQHPVIEREQHPEASSRLLNYLLFEAAFTLPRYREWTLVSRIHHRSGVYGLFNGTRGGSNFLALGLRYHF